MNKSQSDTADAGEAATTTNSVSAQLAALELEETKEPAPINDPVAQEEIKEQPWVIKNGFMFMVNDEGLIASGMSRKFT